MDYIDRKILYYLQKDSRISMTELAQKINLSRPSINARIMKLLEDGTIEQFTIHINPKKLGYSISFITEISEIRVSPNKMVETLSQYPNITAIDAVTGDANYIIKAFARDISEMNLLLKRLMDFGKLKTFIILNTTNQNRLLENGYE